VPEDEWQFYGLDQLINDRGMPIDWDFVTNVIWMSDRRKRQLSDEIIEITGVDNPNSRDQLLPWLQANGYPFDDLRKETVEKALNLAPELWGHEKDAREDECKPAVLVLRRRQWASVRSIDKAVAARRTAGAGHRVRFMYQFAGASRTNRFSGRGVQPHNMKRTPKMLDPEEDDAKLTFATDLIRGGHYDGFDLFIREPMEAFTGAMRSMFRAPDDSEFKVCDYKSVESAGLGWVADCTRLLNVFRENLDPYRDFGTLFYQKAYGDITTAERQICKPPTLGCGYRLSAGKDEDGVKTGLLKYAEDMGVNMTPTQADHAVKVFREGYPEIPQFWYACERAIRYVLTTHQPFTLGYVRFEWMKPYLLIRLPSGRFIYYYKPRLEKRVVDTGRTKWVRSRGEANTGHRQGTLIEVPDTYIRHSFSYMGRNQKTTKWERIQAHGGVTTENIVQALTRDILKVGLQRLHKAGFYIVGHAHDEGICMQKIGDNFYTLDLMREIYREPILNGRPVSRWTQAGWQGKYYRKA
jgi:DNA polymerase